jgi:poly [ADP-ribose] polymerase
MELSGEFFTLIPHDFGFQHMSNFVINTPKKLKEKIEMIESLADIKLATKFISSGDDSDANEIDEHYKRLNCDLTPIDKSEKKYKMIVDYVANTHAATHRMYKLQVEDIFEVKRPGEHERYDTSIGNNMLLWHGSRTSNYVGILS